MDRSGLYLLVFMAVIAATVAEEMYSDIFDHINPDDILPNDELRNQYYNCFMDTGPCVTEEQKFFKRMTLYIVVFFFFIIIIFILLFYDLMNTNLVFFLC